jgi:hypothetical protein
MAESGPFKLPGDVAAVYVDGVRELKAAIAALLAGELSPERCAAAKGVILAVRERTETRLEASYESAKDLRPAFSDFRVENNEAFQGVFMVVEMLALAGEYPALGEQLPAYRETLLNCLTAFDRLTKNEQPDARSD